MFIPQERKQSTPTPILFMKQNALVFFLTQILLYVQSLWNSRGFRIIFSLWCVCVCVHTFLSGWSWYLGLVLRAILHLLLDRSHDHGGSWLYERFWALMVWMLQRYVDRRLNKRKIGQQFAQTFVLFVGEDQTHPDTSLLNSNEHTHTSLGLSVHICVHPHSYCLC